MTDLTTLLIATVIAVWSDGHVTTATTSLEFPDPASCLRYVEVRRESRVVRPYPAGLPNDLDPLFSDVMSVRYLDACIPKEADRED